MKNAVLLRCLFGLLIICACLLVPMTVTSQKSRCSSSKRSGKSLGPQTEAFFDEVVKRKQQLPLGNPSQVDPHSLADLNRDGTCDQRDGNLFRRAMGKCLKPGSSVVVAEADFDGDACVTRKDQRIFLQLWKACKARR